MTIRVRFRLTEIGDLYFSPSAKRLTFGAVQDDTIPADDRLVTGLPSITLVVLSDNPTALAQLELGGEYWFDISPVPA